MSFLTSGRSKAGLRSWSVNQLIHPPMNVRGSVAKVRFEAMLFDLYHSLGDPAGSRPTTVLSNSEPHHGCGYSKRGGPSVVAVPEYVSPLIVPLIGPVRPSCVASCVSLGCFTHCVSPDWPAITATAFGVEGVSSVAKLLSKMVKRLAYRQKNGMVSQSICAMTRRANCLPMASRAAPPARAYLRHSTSANLSILGTPSCTSSLAARPEWE